MLQMLMKLLRPSSTDGETVCQSFHRFSAPKYPTLIKSVKISGKWDGEPKHTGFPHGLCEGGGKLSLVGKPSSMKSRKTRRFNFNDLKCFSFSIRIAISELASNNFLTPNNEQRVEALTVYHTLDCLPSKWSWKCRGSQTKIFFLAFVKFSLQNEQQVLWHDQSACREFTISTPLFLDKHT